MQARRSVLLTFFIIAAFVLFSSLLKADEGANTKAMDEALVKAQAKIDDDVSPDFRQKLKQAVTLQTPKEETAWELDSLIKYMPAKSLKGADGRISIVDAESELSYVFKAAGVLPIELSINSEYIGISDKEVALSLPAHLTGLSFGLQGTFPTFINDNLYLRLKVEPSFFSTNWNAKSSSFRVPTYTYLIYQPNDKWAFVGGIAVFPGYEDNLAPIAGFIYRPNDRLEFNIIPSEPTISYKVNDMFSVFLEGSMSGGEYRVTKDGYKGAVLQYNEIHTGAGLEFTFNKNINASISSGYMFNRYLKYRDSLGKADIKNGIYSELRVEMRI